ncbi:hypothetical protein F0Z19_2394 [Vibrio cyclitrophicus]|nr:hypothetical protein F0Z19_2394 [Vibrio cyclitrophicus]
MCIAGVFVWFMLFLSLMLVYSFVCWFCVGGLVYRLAYV